MLSCCILVSAVAGARDFGRSSYFDPKGAGYALITGLEAKTLYQSVLVDQTVRNYIVFVPAGIAFLKDIPVVFYFHGSVNDPDYYKGVLGGMPVFQSIAEKEKFLLVIPQGSPSASGIYSWADGDASLAFFDTLLAALKVKYPIDPFKIYTTGMSSGAIMSFRLACERAMDIAASVPFSGNYAVISKYQPEKLDCPLTDTPVAIRAYNGDEDPIVSYESTLEHVTIWATQINGCSATDVTVQVSDFLFQYQGGDPNKKKPWEIKHWEGCANGADVEFVTMTGFGHFWTDLASQGVWDFMKNHPKKCDDLQVEANDTCEDFYQQRKGKSPDYLKLCGKKQVDQYKNALGIATEDAWGQFMAPCKFK